MAQTPRLMPEQPATFPLTVRRSELISPSMMRVTVGGPALADFAWRGYDHWFRLFLRLPHQKRFDLPDLAGAKWWTRYLAVPEEIRPHCANYTVADHRAEQNELDIDLVVHRGRSGELEGAAAIWAVGAQPGEELAILDQGLLFDRPDDAGDVLLVADESGLPAAAGILRSLPRHLTGRVIQEVPTKEDRRELDAPEGVAVDWVVRDDAHAVPGRAALAALRGLTSPDPRGYAFVVGESALATEGRRHLHRYGMPKSRITFSGFWKHEPVHEPVYEP
jgi:NADPH-dependent ferric siderophore reductase